MSVTLRLPVQARVSVIASATFGTQPNGTANGYHRVQVCTLLEIVGHDRITPQLGRLVEMAKKMPGGYLD
jgi:hypothetical protein